MKRILFFIVLSTSVMAQVRHVQPVGDETRRNLAGTLGFANAPITEGAVIQIIQDTKNPGLPGHGGTSGHDAAKIPAAYSSLVGSFL